MPSTSALPAFGSAQTTISPNLSPSTNYWLASRRWSAADKDFKNGPDDKMLRHRGIAFDTHSFVVSVDDQIVDLTGKERDILRLFLANPDRVQSRERILNAVWDSQEDPLTNIVDVYVGRLRKKLGEAGNAIQTVRGLGYRLEP